MRLKRSPVWKKRWTIRQIRRIVTLRSKEKRLGECPRSTRGVDEYVGSRSRRRWADAHGVTLRQSFLQPKARRRRGSKRGKSTDSQNGKQSSWFLLVETHQRRRS